MLFGREIVQAAGDCGRVLAQTAPDAAAQKRALRMGDAVVGELSGRQGVGRPLVGGGSLALASRATFHLPPTFFQTVM